MATGRGRGGLVGEGVLHSVWGCFREDRGKIGSEVKLWRKEGIPISRHDAKRTVRKDGLRKEDTEAEPPGWIARGGGPGRGVWV